MNLAVIKVGLQSFIHGTAMFLKQHAPEILVGSGIVGFAGTVFLGCKATLKAEDILEEKEEKLKQAENETEEKLIKKQTFWKVAKTYAPTATLGLASVALILCGHGMLGKRAAMTAAGYKALEASYAKYRERVADVIGQDEEAKLRDGQEVNKVSVKERLDKPEEEFQKEREERPVFGENSFYFSHATSSLWVDDAEQNLRTLMRFQRFAEDRLVTQGFLFVNDILYDLGMDQTGWGSTHGWILEKGKPIHISFGLEFDEEADVRRFLERRTPDAKLIFNCESAPINTRIDRASKDKKRAAKEMLEMFKHRDRLNNGFY